MLNSIQFNENMFLLLGFALAITCIVYGLIPRRKRPLDATHTHVLAHRQYEASVCAEQQAEQIIRSCWPEEVI